MTLLAGFEGDDNSAKVLLDKLRPSSNISKLYLKNDFDECALQITAHIHKKYDFIVAFGQKPVIKNIYIEQHGLISGQRYTTTFPCEILKSYLISSGYSVKLSGNAGNYLCNHVYGTGLRFIKQQQLLTEYIFIHLPMLKNISNIDALADTFSEFIQSYYIGYSSYNLGVEKYFTRANNQDMLGHL